MSNADVPAGRVREELETALAGRLKALSPEQKVRLLTGADFWSLWPEPAIGLRRLVVSDGPAGARGERWDERDASANVPSPTALSATWDEARVERVGRLLAAECRRKGVDVLLAPTVNLHRSPYGGRHFECFSEDPLLTARIGVAYVRGLQAGGVGATVEHFVANDSETDRFSVDVRVDECALRELYLPPFEAIVEAGVWAVMAAYNSVNGTTMTEHPMLREVLKDEWGFDGVVMSDWFAARSTEPAANAGLDLVMPGPSGPWGDRLVAAVRAGRVAEATVDEVPAVLLCWFPGQEFGHALADVLLGAAEPGGRLPVTWPAADHEAIPSTRPVNGRLVYDEALHLGHRADDGAGIEPAFCFGHGLGFTSWSWERIEAPSRIAAGDDLTVRVRLRNTGRRAGKRVVAQVRVASRAFQHWSVADHAWRAEPGTFRVTAGPSVMDQPLLCDVEVTREPSVGLPTNPSEGESPAQAPPARGRRRAT